MASTRVPNATRNAGLDAVTALLNAAATAGYIEIRTGAPPADPDDAASGTLLATIPVNDPAFNGSVDGVAVADNTPAMTAPATTDGNAGWFRAFDGDDAKVIDGDVTATGDGGDMTINTITLVQDVDVTVTGWSITWPATVA